MQVLHSHRTLDIPKLQRRFNLSYHLNSCDDCSQKCGFEDKVVLEVGGSLPEELVIRELGARSWIALEDPDYYHGQTRAASKALQEIHSRNPIEMDSLSSESLREGYQFALGKVENLPESWSEQFDLAFSIAAFEHLMRMPDALQNIKKVLRPGGALYTFASPVWSSPIGHHIPPITDLSGRTFTFNNSPIPKHGHLLMRPAELHAYLKKQTDIHTANTLVHYVYHSRHINRLFTEDYLQYFEHSGLILESLELTGISKSTETRKATLESLYPGHTSFANTGIVAVLRKPIL